MKKIELLSPVSNMEALYQAIHNGCDAVYLGGKNFGARKFAPNLTLEELKEATSYCHLYNVKIYITVNTLVKTNEVSSFMEYVKYLYEIGVDALIMQDMGMIMKVRKKFPDFEIHASTQANNHNSSSLKILEKLGVKRAVLARELSIDEINKLDTNLDLEVFIHGALCVCYSGCCLFSSIVKNRSGNRGECAGSCRLPYKLLQNNKEISKESYLLSMKELNTSYDLEKLLNTKVISLKIEGRMKSPEYVGFITKYYRMIIDHYQLGKKLDLKELEEDLKILYTREFTKGFLFNEENNLLTNTKSPNHIGLKIGKVIDVTNQKIKIKLSKELTQQDGIRFLESQKGMIVNFLYDEKGKLINSANSGQIVLIDNKIGLTKKDLNQVNKTSSYNLSKELKNYKEKKMPISFFIEAKVNKPLKVTISDKSNQITIEGDTVKSSKNAPITKERIKEIFKKLGQTPFYLEEININIPDSIFLPISKINHLRREAVNLLINKKRESKRKVIEQEECYEKLKITKTNEISIYVTNEEQLLTSLIYKDFNYVVSDFNLFNKYYKKIDNLYYRNSRTAFDTFVKNKKMVITSLSLLDSENEKVGDYFLNIENPYSLYFYNSFGLKKLCLSVETKDQEIQVLLNNYKKLFNEECNVEKMIYGRVELMIMKYSPIKKLLNDQAEFNKNYSFALKDYQNEIYPLYTDENKTHLLHSKIINDIEKIDYYKSLGITNFKIEFFNETKEEVIKILETLKEKTIVLN